MNMELFKQLSFFKRVNIPRYIEARLQKTALKHLELPDMGKLRDRMEGQLYYDKLRTDVLAEYAFENLIGIKKFDWDKRDNKNYKRKQYSFDGKKLSLVTIIDESFPKVNIDHVNNCVFAYVNPQNHVFVSGIATKSKMKEIAALHNSKTIQIKEFNSLIEYLSIDELLDKIE